MDIEAFKKFYIDPVSLGPDDMPQALPQIFKDRSILKIAPDESDALTRNIITFNQRNLDIITLPGEAYIYIQCGFKGTLNNVTDTDLSGTTHYNSATNHFYSAGVPASTGLFDGFDYKINDTSIDQHNNSLSASLYALNMGQFSPENRVESMIGLANFTAGPVYYQANKTNNTQEWKIPFKYFIPYLKENKIAWGTKQTLVLTKQTVMNNIFTIVGALQHENDKITAITYKKIELHMPYVKLENSKQRALWNSMYASKVDRYWVSNEQFLSGPIDNKVAHTNEIFRIATKGLNSRPRYLIVSAITTEEGTALINPYIPMGFDANAANNSFRPTKLRVKLNGIYIDNGDVLEMTVRDASAGNPYLDHSGYMIAYENYCKFFGQLGDASKPSPLPFQSWLSWQVYVFDLTNVDAESIFSNSGSAIICELEFSTKAGSTTDDMQFRFAAQLLHDKTLSIQHSNNSAFITQS